MRHGQKDMTTHAVLTTPADRTGACRFLPCPRGLPGRVGIHDFTFEACSSFTRVTACTVACLVPRLRPGQLPDQAAR
jgi:hypothetical protein